MNKHEFGVSVEVDNETGEILAVYFQVRRGRSARTQEYGEGTVFVDYNGSGELLGVEMLAPCEINVLEQITTDEPEARQFVRRSAPREMVIG